MAAPYYRDKFSFDEGPSWPGWTTGETWNGWGMPHFEREQAERIARWMKQQGIIEDWWWERDGLCTSDEQNPKGDCWQERVISTPEGLKTVYPMGAQAWSWWTSEHGGDEEEEGEPARGHAWGIPRRENAGRKIQHTDRPQVRFCVHWWTKIDRPEKRGPSFQPVPPGTALHDTRCFPTAKKAVAYYEWLISGEQDFAGEFVNQAWIDREVGNHRTIYRKGVNRVRAPDGSVQRAANVGDLRARLI